MLKKSLSTDNLFFASKRFQWNVLLETCFGGENVFHFSREKYVSVGTIHGNFEKMAVKS
jgi:hypothetical protein